jgi:ribosome maturation factor RimP
VAVASNLRETLIALLEPLLTSLGFELADLEFSPGRGHSQLRVYIDAAAGVVIEDCERCSREISALLDVNDPIPSAYTLEVSSPGLDRVLRTPAHYGRFVGAQVQVELLVPREGRRRYTGRLQAVTATGVELEVDGVQVQVGFADISRTRLVPEWPDNSSKGRRR